MKTLLDTCALIALANGSLPSRSRKFIEGSTDVFTSVVSFLEISLKHASGKLLLNLPPTEWHKRLIEHYKIQELPLTKAIITESSDLPRIHNDPFDRLLIATARINKLAIITSDRQFSDYPGLEIIWKS